MRAKKAKLLRKEARREIQRLTAVTDPQAQEKRQRENAFKAAVVALLAKYKVDLIGQFHFERPPGPRLVLPGSVDPVQAASREFDEIEQAFGCRLRAVPSVEVGEWVEEAQMTTISGLSPEDIKETKESVLADGYDFVDEEGCHESTALREGEK